MILWIWMMILIHCKKGGYSEGTKWLKTARPNETQKLHQICWKCDEASPSNNKTPGKQKLGAL
jgi:hypothetical protein